MSMWKHSAMTNSQCWLNLGLYAVKQQQQQKTQYIFGKVARQEKDFELLGG